MLLECRKSNLTPSKRNLTCLRASSAQPATLASPAQHPETTESPQTVPRELPDSHSHSHTHTATGTATITENSHSHSYTAISAGLGIENISYPRAWIWKKSHIRRPGYGKKTPCASMWGACFYLGRVCFNVGCLLLSRVHRFASNWLIG